MNRAQRRAALKQSRLAKGFDATKGTLDVPIAGSNEKITVDVMDFEVVSSIMELIHKFSNVQEYYKEDYEKAFNTQDADGYAVFMFAKKLVTDFSEYTDKIFGEDACKKIFGHKYPQFVQIQEFIEDFTPVAQAIIAASGMNDLVQGANESEAATSDTIVQMPLA